VLDIHDLHVRNLCSGYISLSAHIITSDPPLAHCEDTMADLKRRLSILEIEHTTIQFACGLCGQGTVLVSEEKHFHPTLAT
jgi:Co/Zn/Cd efflux system component